MGAGCDGDVVLCYVYTDGQALGVDIGEVMFGLLRILVRDVEADMVDRMDLHLVIDRPCDDVAWCERETRIVFLHELLAVR